MDLETGIDVLQNIACKVDLSGFAFSASKFHCIVNAFRDCATINATGGCSCMLHLSVDTVIWTRLEGWQQMNADCRPLCTTTEHMTVDIGAALRDAKGRELCVADNEGSRMRILNKFPVFLRSNSRRLVPRVHMAGERLSTSQCRQMPHVR